jgi:hypothetical protein
MKLTNLKRTIAASAFGLIALLGTGEIANAQNNRQVQRQQDKVILQQQKVANQRAKLEAQRIKLEQQRQEQLRVQNIRNNRNDSVYSNNNRNNNNRYRVYRNGSYYQTDNRGAELLHQAVNSGYQQGVRAGQADRSSRRGSNYGNSSIYRSGNYGYQSYVDSSQYQYYFRQGFERGYQDGYNSRYQNGTNNNGAFNILGTILSGILNIQQF